MQGMSFILFYAVIVVALFGFAIQFITLRIRDSRANPQDPHLGRKSLFYFFFNCSILLVLVGVTYSTLNIMELTFESAVMAQERRKSGSPDPPTVDPITGQPIPAVPKDWFNDQQRTALSLLTSGVIYAVLFGTLIRLLTNDREFPSVRRAFASLRFALAGIVVMATTTAAIFCAFERGEFNYKSLEVIFAISMIWWPVAVLHLILMVRTSHWHRSPVK